MVSVHFAPERTDVAIVYFNQDVDTNKPKVYDVKAWAQQMLPALKHHLEEIKMIEEKLKAKAK